MPTPPLPVAELHCTLVAIVEHGSVSEAARQTGAARPALNHRAQQIRARWPGLLPEGQGNGLWAAGLAVPTLEEMEASDLHPRSVHRRAVSDLRAGVAPAEGFAVTQHTAVTDKDGGIVREFIQQRPEPGPQFEMPPDFKINKQTILVDRDDRIERRWIKLREDAVGRGLVEALQEAFETHRGTSISAPEPDHCESDLLTEYPVPDLHLGMYAWHRECGDNYDVDIAVDIATRTVQSLVDQSRPTETAVLLILGDYTHANDEKAITPASGHRLDTDGRWQRSFAAGARLLVSLVDIVTKKHRNVILRVVRGNHDPDSAVCLTVALGLYYDNNPRITVEDSPSIGWYYRFGECLLGAFHGHTMKPEAMAMAMAVDRAEDWGQTQFRHIAFGHIHHHTAKEVMGVLVESFQSPAAKDSYNAEHGYRAGRSLSAITWHRNLGEIGRHRVAIGVKSRAA